VTYFVAFCFGSGAHDEEFGLSPDNAPELRTQNLKAYYNCNNEVTKGVSLVMSATATQNKSAKKEG